MTYVFVGLFRTFTRAVKASLMAGGAGYMAYVLDKAQGGAYAYQSGVVVGLLVLTLVTGVQMLLDYLPVSQTFTHVHVVEKPNITPTVVARVVLPRLEDSPTLTGYQTFVAYDDPFRDCPLPRDLLRSMVISLLKTKDGHASTHRLFQYKDKDVRTFGKWLIGRGYAGSVRNSAVLLPEKRDTLLGLLPSLGEMPEK